MASTFINLCGYADWSAPANATPLVQSPATDTEPEGTEELRKPEIPIQEHKTFDLNYDIHIHLPATRDQAVYDALFASLAKHIPLK